MLRFSVWLVFVCPLLCRVTDCRELAALRKRKKTDDWVLTIKITMTFFNDARPLKTMCENDLDESQKSLPGGA